jgi:hypothetical protein
MTRDDILRMAREAQWLGNIEGWTFNSYDELERFFKLAYEAGAAAERNRMISDGWRQCAQDQRTTQFCAVAERARAEEREACAKVCEDDPSRAWDWLGEIRPGGHYAAAIRAQAADRLARHGIQLPDEDDHDGNPSF